MGKKAIDGSDSGFYTQGHKKYVKEQMQKEGFSLEIQVYEMLKKRGWDAKLGDHYWEIDRTLSQTERADQFLADLQSSTLLYREMDVVAERSVIPIKVGLFTSARVKLVVEESYQKRTSIVYSPATYGLRFYDDDWNLLGTKNESLTYELTRQVEKDTGKRTLALNPFGSTIVALAAYYDNPMVYGYTLNYWYNGEPGSYSNVFMPNASVWEIGNEAFPNWTVSAEGTFQGYETWNVQYNQVPPGYSEFYDSTEYEKTSGLVVKDEFRGVMPNEFYWEMKERATDLGDVIDDGPPVVSAFPAGIVSSMDPIIITFNGTDLHFSHYNLYRNDTLIETGTEQKVNWTFEVVPTEGNTTYRFEIVDTLGHSSSASLWVLFVPEPDSGIPLGTLAIVCVGGAGVVGVSVIVVFLRRSRPSYGE